MSRPAASPTPSSAMTSTPGDSLQVGKTESCRLSLPGKNISFDNLPGFTLTICLSVLSYQLLFSVTCLPFHISLLIYSIVHSLTQLRDL